MGSTVTGQTGPFAVNSKSLKASIGLETACFEYLEAIRTDLRIKDASSEFIIKNINTGELGISHVKMQQVYKGVPVYGAEVYLNTLWTPQPDRSSIFTTTRKQMATSPQQVPT